MAKRKTVEVNVMEVREEIARKEQEIRNLEAALSSVSSNIGDYKIIKCMEYQILGMEMPYDINELNEERQAVRDQINTLEDEIAGLQTQVYAVTAE